MSIIEELKQDYEDFVPHDDECDIYLTLRMKPACNCSRRRKIAALDSLDERIKIIQMTADFGIEAGIHQGAIKWKDCLQSVVTLCGELRSDLAAEEDLP